MKEGYVDRCTQSSLSRLNIALGYILKRSPITPYSVYLRGTIYIHKDIIFGGFRVLEPTKVWGPLLARPHNKNYRLWRSRGFFGKSHVVGHPVNDAGLLEVQ